MDTSQEQKKNRLLVFLYLINDFVFFPKKTIRKIDNNFLWVGILSFLIYLSPFVIGIIFFVGFANYFQTGSIVYGFFASSIFLNQFLFCNIAFLVSHLVIVYFWVERQKYNLQTLFTCFSLWLLICSIILCLLVGAQIVLDKKFLAIALVVALVYFLFIKTLIIKEACSVSWGKSICVVMSILMFYVPIDILIGMAAPFLTITGYRGPAEIMKPTLQPQDRILVDNIHYRFFPVSRGDLIIFTSVEDDYLVLQRVVGLPGETIEIKNNGAYINGKRLQDEILFPKDREYHDSFQNFPVPWAGAGKPLTIPQNCYFVLGDNSDSSNDSRFWAVLPRQNIKGRVICLWYPFSRIRIFANE